MPQGACRRKQGPVPGHGFGLCFFGRSVYHKTMEPTGNEKAFLVYMTAPTLEEARMLARELVRQRLAAGVNVLPGAESVYRWQGAVREAGECLLLAQVSGAALPAFIATARSLHSYEVPCIVAMPMAAGHPPFLRWIAENSLPPTA